MAFLVVFSLYLIGYSAKASSIKPILVVLNLGGFWKKPLCPLAGWLTCVSQGPSATARVRAVSVQPLPLLAFASGLGVSTHMLEGLVVQGGDGRGDVCGMCSLP